MDQLLQQVLAHLRGMWNRRLIGLSAAWIAAIIGLVVAFRIPERYETSARVHVDTQTVLKPILAGLTYQPNMDQQVALISRTLLNRPNVDRLIQTAHLDVGAKSDADREKLIDNLEKSIRIDGNVSNNLFVISYRDPNPQRAKDVVDALLTIFVDSSLGGKRDDSRTALKFLDEQIAQYVQSLQKAENRLKEFRLKYLGVPGQGGQPGQDYYGRMSKLSDDIANARLELHAAIESRDAYRRELSAQTPTMLSSRTGPGGSVPAREIDVRLAAQKSKLDELLRSFTDQHPDVVGTRRVIAELEDQRKAEDIARQRAAASGKSIEPTEPNPIYQQMRVSLADAEAKVASLQARLSSYEGQYSQLKSSARLVPEVEAELAQLNRDYDIQKKIYSDLLARREATAMGADVQEIEGEQFRIIDPPRVSSQPVQPTRLSMLLAAFLGAVGIGLLASFVVNEIAPTFHDARSLREVTGRPLLGTLSLVPNEAAKRQRHRRNIVFLGGFGGFMASFAAIVAIALLVGRAA